MNFSIENQTPERTKNNLGVNIYTHRRYFGDKIHGIIVNNTKSNIYKISNTAISGLSDEDLIDFLISKEISNLDISLLAGKNLEKINRILTQNFPLLEISRLVPGDKLLNINISGIKQINDITGQDFCDKVILKFKELLKNQFSKTNQNSTHKGRIVKDDYKNITFETSSENPLQTIFGEITSKQEIINYILSSLKKEVEENARNILENQVQSGNLKIQSQKHFEKLVLKEINEIKSVVLRYFDFGVGESIIPGNAQDIEKLDSIRKAEISSRVGRGKDDKIILREYSQEEILKSLKKSLELEEEIIEKFKGKKFNFEGVDYNIVFNSNGNSSLSTEILRYVRKYPEKVKPKDLVELVKNYINHLNSSLDFISPVKDELKNGGNEFKQAKAIDTQIKSGIIDTKYLTQNYKGGLTKTAFFKKTSNKNGTKIFIDIKDMGIDNLVDFNLRAKQIINLNEDLKNGKLDLKTFKEKQAKIFLEAGKSVSDKFIEIQKRIKETYPDAILCFGGDEIYLFIPDKKTDFPETIEENLTTIFNSTNQKTRIVIDQKKETKNSKDNFARLEKITKLNKILEESIEKQLNSKQIKLEGNIPNNTYVKISESLEYKIMSPDFHIDDFLKEVKKNIQGSDLLGDKSKKIILGKTTSLVEITILKKANNVIEIYLNN